MSFVRVRISCEGKAIGSGSVGLEKTILQAVGELTTLKPDDILSEVTFIVLDDLDTYIGDACGSHLEVRLSGGTILIEVGTLTWPRKEGRTTERLKDRRPSKWEKLKDFIHKNHKVVIGSSIGLYLYFEYKRGFPILTSASSKERQ